MDKPAGVTSHDVVAFGRRALGQTRIGHTGTLDPFATGVLPLACGRATRLVRFMTASDKDYDATLRFGLTTDTYDITGTETSRSDARPSPEMLSAAIASLCGDQLQVPPPYSAKKIDGRRAYDLARRRQPVVLPPARVRLHRADLRELTSDHAVVRLTCSSGYYVRSFAHDVGARLGMGACLEALRRTRSGQFGLAGAVTFADMEAGRAAAAVVPMARLLTEFPAVVLSPAGRERLQHGQSLRPTDMLGGSGAVTGASAGPGGVTWVRLLDADGALVGMGTPWDEDGALRPNIVLI